MERIHCTSNQLDDEGAAEYITNLTEQLLVIARGRRLNMLAYLLSLVAHEGRDIATSHLGALRDWPVRLGRISAFKTDLERIS